MRIGAHLTGMELQMLNRLWEANLAAQENSLRLVTGEKVSRPSQDPAAFVQVSGMQSQLNAVNDTVSRIETAATLGAQAQLTVDQIRTQLDSVRSTLLEDVGGGLTPAQRIERQAQIDAAIDAIDGLARTELSGKRLFDGTTDYSFVGRDSSQVRELDVFALGSENTTIAGTVTQAAQRAELEYQGKGNKVKDDATFKLTGSRGAAVVTVTKNGSLTDAADEINSQSHNTGVTASVAGNTLTFTTVDYGDDATIAVDVSAGKFDVTGGNGDGTANGVDAEVTVNGESVAANQTTGNTVTYARNGLRVRLEFAEGFSGDFDTITVREGGALNFALSPEPYQLTQLALPSVTAAHLGGISGGLTDLLEGGSLSGLGDNTSQAIRVVDEALGRLALVEAHVDSFADIAVASSAALMGGFAEILDSNGDGTVDLNEADDQEESLLMTKNQSLAANALASLAIAQQQQQNVLTLLYRAAGMA